MGLKETLSLLITADAKGAISALEKTGAAADKELGKTQDHLEQTGKKMQSVGAGMVVTGGLLVAGFAAAAFASEAADKSVLKLENSLNGNAKIAGTSAKVFTDLAKAIQSKTAADGDAIVSGESILIQMGLTTQQVTELTPLAVDLARKLGIDLDTAFKMVGKSVEGSAGALKKAGIIVDDTKYKTDAYGATVDALSLAVGGFAQEEGQTFSGSLERLKNQLGDLEEGVGKGAAEAFQQMLGPVTSVVDALSGLDPQLLATAGHIGAFASVGLSAGGGLLMTAGRMLELDSVLRKADGGMSAFSKATIGITAALVAAGLASEAWSQRTGTLTLNMKELTGATDAQLNASIKRFITLGAAAKGGLDELGKTVAAESIPTALRLADAMDRNGIASEEFRKGIGQTKTELATATADQKGHSDAVQEEATVIEQKAVPSLKDYQDSLKKADDAQRHLTDSIKAATDPWFAVIDATDRNRDAQIKATEAQVALTEAIQDHGRKSPEAVKAQRDLEQANYDVVKSATSVDQSIRDLTVSVQSGSTSWADADLVLRGWVDQGLITEGQAAQVRDRLGEVANNASALDGKSIQMSVELDMSQAQARLSTFIRDNGAFAIAAREGRAAGGPVSAGTAYTVGENGPETLVMGSNSGTIIPNGVNVGGGGVTEFHAHFHGTVIAEEQALVALMEKAFRRGLRPGDATRRALA